MSVSPIPDGYHSVTPYLIAKNAPEAIQFYQQAFGAVETMRLEMPDGGIAHAEFKVGDSQIMIGEENEEMGFLSPHLVGGCPMHLMIYVEDADAVFQQAIDAGAEELRPVADQFYGDRSGMLKDPYGYTWSIATHTEDVTEEEVNQRFAEMMNTPEA